jgi:hypothetical protein
MNLSLHSPQDVRPKGVFISYRRDGGSYVARIIEGFLDGRGYEVFLDVDDLGGGHFDEMLLREIEKKDAFILICSPGCFDRCIDPQDWVRRELEHALENRKKIIPVTLTGFHWPDADELPESIREIQRHNAFEFTHTYWKLAQERLVSLIETWRSGPGDAPAPAERAQGAKEASKNDEKKSGQ